MSAWQPIETAPKDGKILLWCSNLRREYPDYEENPIGVVMGTAHDGYISGNGMNGPWTFTHWQPHPKAPA